MDRGAWIFAGITALVALYGAALSTYSVVASRRDKKRHILVTVSHAVMVPAGVQKDVVALTAANPGDRAVTLGLATLTLPNGWNVVPARSNSEVAFPYELPEGKSCTCWIDSPELAAVVAEQGYRSSVKLVATYRSVLGATYRSKKMKFDVRHWLAQPDSTPDG